MYGIFAKIEFDVLIANPPASSRPIAAFALKIELCDRATTLRNELCTRMAFPYTTRVPEVN